MSNVQEEEIYNRLTNVHNICKEVAGCCTCKLYRNLCPAELKEFSNIEGPPEEWTREEREQIARRLMHDE